MTDVNAGNIAALPPASGAAQDNFLRAQLALYAEDFQALFLAYTALASNHEQLKASVRDGLTTVSPKA